MAEPYWRETGSSDGGTQRLLPVRNADQLWALGPVEIDHMAVLAVVDGPRWRALWRASQRQPCAVAGDELWHVTQVTVDERVGPMKLESFALTDDVCDLIREGRHLRFEDRPQPGVELVDAGGYDCFEHARAEAYNRVQRVVPDSLRRTHAKLFEPPDAVPPSK